MTSYVIYRHGSNSANQPMCQVAPVAVVEAASAAEACEVTGDDEPTLYSSNWLVLAPWIDLWNNQHVTAKPASKASRRDFEAAANDTAEMTRLVPAADCGCQICGAKPPADLPAYLAYSYHCGCRLVKRYTGEDTYEMVAVRP